MVQGRLLSVMSQQIRILPLLTPKATHKSAKPTASKGSSCFSCDHYQLGTVRFKVFFFFLQTLCRVPAEYVSYGRFPLLSLLRSSLFKSLAPTYQRSSPAAI